MRFIYTIHHKGKAVYHGINAVDALDTILAYQNRGEKVEVQRTYWPMEARADITPQLAA